MRKLLILTSFVISIALIGLYLFIQSNWLQVTTYHIDLPKAENGLDGFRILQLSDLHSKSFGKNNSRLIRHIQNNSPDIIVMSGEMINATDDDGAVVINLIEGLGGRYPIFYGLGNHEQLANQYAKETGSDKYDMYVESLRENDVVILDNSKTEFAVGNTPVKLYGFTLPVEYYHIDRMRKFLFETELEEGAIRESLGESDPEAINILLAHAPKFFEDYVEWGADLVFSGHVHGGLIRIPGIGGLVAPSRGSSPIIAAGNMSGTEKP